VKFLTILTLVIGYFVYLVYRPYLLDIAIASLMAVAFGKINLILSKKIDKHIYIAVIDTVILAFLIFGPFLYFVIELGKLVTNFDPQVVKNILEQLQKLIEYLPDIISEKIKNILSPENFNQLYQTVLPVIGTVTQKSALFFKDAFLIVIFFFFAVLYGKEILNFFKKIIPMSEKQLETLFFNTSEVMSVVFYSTILTALLEGVLFGFIVSFFGLDFFFFAVMYAFASLIPVIGGIIMWGPVSLYLYSQGNVQGAIIVALYSIIVISIIADTFIKPLIIVGVKKFFETEIEINSLLIFFAIVAGLSSFGLWGIIIGPAITTMFISVLKFYEKV